MHLNLSRAIRAVLASYIEECQTDWKPAHALHGVSCSKVMGNDSNAAVAKAGMICTCESARAWFAPFTRTQGG